MQKKVRPKCRLHMRNEEHQSLATPSSSFCFQASPKPKALSPNAASVQRDLRLPRPSPGHLHGPYSKSPAEIGLSGLDLGAVRVEGDLGGFRGAKVDDVGSHHDVTATHILVPGPPSRPHGPTIQP